LPCYDPVSAKNLQEVCKEIGKGFSQAYEKAVTFIRQSRGVCGGGKVSGRIVGGLQSNAVKKSDLVGRSAIGSPADSPPHG
jgi:hypothetical protein